MNTDALLQELMRLNVPVKTYAGWRERNHGPLNAHAISVHDSVTGHMSANTAAQFCITGRSDLKGPLYECMVAADGVAHLIANGITYSSGKGNRDRMTMATRGVMPLGQELPRPAPGDWNGNTVAHGIAMVTYGAGPYTMEQLEACARVCAAYGKTEGWGNNTAGSVIGHGEFSSRKVDPFTDMGSLRTRINAIIHGSVETWHTVVSGDTLWSLARRFSVSVAQIRTWNGLSSDVIGIGWRLRVK